MHRSRASVVVLALTLIALLSSPLASFALSSSDADAARERAEAARQKQAAAEKQADRLLSDAKKIESTIARTRDELKTINGKMATVEVRRSRVETEMVSIRRRIAKKQSEITRATAAYCVRRETLSRRLDAVYRQGDLFYIQMLLDSRSLTDLIARTSFVEQVMLEDQSIMIELSANRRSLEVARGTLDRELRELDAKRAELASEENAIRELQSERASRLADERDARSAKIGLLAETKSNISHLKASVAAEEAEAARIERMLRDSASHGSGSHEGAMTWPTPGYTTVTSGYGWRTHPILGTRKMHTGIDIRAPEGARIVAVASGEVIFSGDRGGYGNCIMIDHGNGLVSVYAHQSSLVVSEGARVRKGQKIGEVGSTGLSTGPHLHFEIRVNGDPRNPLNYL